MGNRKQPSGFKINKNPINITTPYGYVSPATNFTEDSPNLYGEANAINAFNEGFNSSIQLNVQLDTIISQFQSIESGFLDELKEKGVLKEEPDENGFFQIEMNSQNQSQKHKELTQLLDLIGTDINNLKKANRSATTTKLFKEQLASLVEKLFLDNSLDLSKEMISPKEVWDALRPEAKAQWEQDVTIKKLIANLLAFYEKDPEVRKKEESLYSQLKDYAKKAGITKSARSQSLEQQETITIADELNKMVYSAIGKIKNILGEKTEECVLDILQEHGIQALNTGKAKGKITLTYDVMIPEDKLNKTIREQTEFQQQLLTDLNKSSLTVRNPKADIVMENHNKKSYGISVKHSIIKPTKELSANLVLHNGTYLSLIRYLARYKAALPLAEHLMKPEVMHAALNMTRADLGAEISSPSLDEAATQLAFVFFGAGDMNGPDEVNNLLTDYGKAAFSGTTGKNTVAALIDSQGNGRLISSYLQDIRDNLEKSELSIKFKMETEPGHFFSHPDVGGLSYHTVAVYSCNYATSKDYSAIMANVWLRTH